MYHPTVYAYSRAAGPERPTRARGSRPRKERERFGCSPLLASSGLYIPVCLRNSEAIFVTKSGYVGEGPLPASSPPVGS